MTETHERLRGFWDADSEIYDRSPSHALTDPVEAAAWRAVLSRWLPPAPATVLDAEAGTGSLSMLLLELGHRVTALDISPGLLARAREKAAGRGFELAQPYPLGWLEGAPQYALIAQGS
jgi:SAM-dependent methyltransferase